MPKHSPPVPPAAEILEPTCACGCGFPVSIARKTDARTGAVAGQPLKFLKGHAARVHSKLEFADITPAWFDAHVTLSIAKGCWLADAIQISVGGRRVYTAHLVLLLHRGLPVTAKALDWLRVHRCRRHQHCVRPDHTIEIIDPNAASRAAAIEHGRARLAAFRAERASANQETPIIPSTPTTGSTPVQTQEAAGAALHP